MEIYFKSSASEPFPSLFPSTRVLLFKLYFLKETETLSLLTWLYQVVFVGLFVVYFTGYITKVSVLLQRVPWGNKIYWNSLSTLGVKLLFKNLPSEFTVEENCQPHYFRVTRDTSLDLNLCSVFFFSFSLSNFLILSSISSPFFLTDKK